MIIRVIFLVIFVSCLFAAIEHLTNIKPSLAEPTRYAYYNYLIDSFFHGRTNVIDTYSLLDLSLFNHKHYLYWGPAPILFILPFYLISGLKASDVIYTMFAGVCNAVLFYFVIEEFISYFKLKKTVNSKLILLVNFAFVSPHLFLSTFAGIWYTNQIIATFYLLIFYLSFFKFLRNNKWPFLLLSIIFFNLAWFSRYIYFLNIVLFLFPILVYLQKRKKVFINIISPLIIITIFFVGLFMFYNFIRFDSFIETGHRYVRGDPSDFSDAYLQERIRKNTNAYQSNAIFSIKYIPENISYYFFNHLAVSDKFPFLIPDKEGNSIFSVYPLFFLSIYLFQKKYMRSRKIVLFLLLSTIFIIMNLTVIMSFVRYSHWSPFGTRYIFDIVPLLYLLFLFIIEDVPLALLYGLTLYGIFVNFFGIFNAFILHGFI